MMPNRAWSFYGSTFHQCNVAMVYVLPAQHRCMDPPANGQDGSFTVWILGSYESSDRLDRRWLDPVNGECARLHPIPWVVFKLLKFLPGGGAAPLNAPQAAGAPSS